MGEKMHILKALLDAVVIIAFFMAGAACWVFLTS
jgi:hypothetical protein